jgi:hypothetical protein
MQIQGTASRYLRGIQMMYFHVHSVIMEILSSQLPRTTHAESGGKELLKGYSELQEQQK